MDKQSFIRKTLQLSENKLDVVEAYAPANIALVKYWGKRDIELNCPLTDSLSISLGHKGCRTQMSRAEQSDTFIINDVQLAPNSVTYQRLQTYLNLFRPHAEFYYAVSSESSVPLASGLASSACGFAALVKCLNQFFAWQCDEQLLSVFARMGSGSACRSLWHGFVKWHAGQAADGMDSYAAPLPYVWPSLRIGLVIHTTFSKKISSTQGMLQTQQTSPFMSLWPDAVKRDCQTVEQALLNNDFHGLAETSECNAQAMHALMLSARPSINYFSPETIQTIQRIHELRDDGINLYYTQDAGPNIKLLFLEENESVVRELFPEVDIIAPFLKDYHKCT